LRLPRHDALEVALEFEEPRGVVEGFGPAFTSSGASALHSVEAIPVNLPGQDQGDGLMGGITCLVVRVVAPPFGYAREIAINLRPASVARRQKGSEHVSFSSFIRFRP